MSTVKTKELIEAAAVEASLALPKELFNKLSNDLKEYAAKMAPQEARGLVDGYYQMQKRRTASTNQAKAHHKTGDPSAVLVWLMQNAQFLENLIKHALEMYATNSELGLWLGNIYGVGPVLASGFMAHFDVTKAKHAGSFWKYAGLCADQEWKKGEKRPWNAQAKTLCWKFSNTQMKFKGNDRCFYGKLHGQRHSFEIDKNNSGKNEAAAAEKLRKFKITDPKTLKCYKSGKLPDGHVLARTDRWLSKLFLSNFFEAAWIFQYKTLPPDPYITVYGDDQGVKHDLESIIRPQSLIDLRATVKKG